MSQKRKRDESPDALDDSRDTVAPALKRAKTSQLRLPTNADALALLMGESDLITAARIAATCRAGQQVWNDVSSMYWYLQAKKTVPGLSGWSLAINYRKMVEGSGLLAVAKHFVPGAILSEALIIPTESDKLDAAVLGISAIERRLEKLHSAVGTIEATVQSRLAVQARPPLVISTSLTDDYEEDEDENGKKSSDLTLYRRMAFQSAPLISYQDCLGNDDFPVQCRIVFASIVVTSPSGDRHCCFELAYDDVRTQYEPSIVGMTNHMFYKLDSDPKFTLLDDSLLAIADWDSLFGDDREAVYGHLEWFNGLRDSATGKYKGMMDSATAKKILDAVGVSYVEDDEDKSLRWAWNEFYRRLVAFMCIKSSINSIYPAAIVEPYEKKTDGPATPPTAESRADFISKYVDSIYALINADMIDEAQMAAAASLALRHVACLRRLTQTLRLAALTLLGKDESVNSLSVASEAFASEESAEADNPFTILDVTKESTAKDIISAAGLPFGTGCAFYEVRKSESVSKSKLIVVYALETKKWLENDAARAAIGAPVGSDAKIGPKAGFRIFVQSTSPNRKIPAGSGLLYKGEITTKKKETEVKKVKRRKRGSDDEDEEEEEEEDAEGNATSNPVDISARGKLSMLSFFGATGERKQAVVNLCNNMWLSAFEEDLCHDDPCNGSDSFSNIDYHFSSIFRIPTPAGEQTTLRFGAGFECEINVDGDELSNYKWIWNLEKQGHDRDLAVVTQPQSAPTLAELRSVPTELGLLSTAFFGLFESAEVVDGGQRRFLCPGKAGPIKQQVARTVLKRILPEVLSKETLDYVSKHVLE